MKKHVNHSFFETTLGFITIVIIVISIYGIGGYVMWNIYFKHEPSDAGTFGDMFGGITSFFSAVTVILVFYAARLQKQELDSTRQELIQQNETTKLQRFETTFFNLLELYNQIRKEVTYTTFTYDYNEGHTQKTFTGIPALEIINEYWNEKFKTNGTTTQYVPASNPWFTAMYNDGRDREAEIPHYYNHILNTFTLIMHAGLTDEQEKFYSKIFSTLFSPIEVALMHYHIGLQKNLSEELKIFVSKLDFMRTVQADKFFGHPSYWSICFPNG